VDQETEIRLIASYWTIGGVVGLIIALGLSVVLYESSRTVSIAPLYEEKEASIYEKFDYVAMIWNMRAIILFLIGGTLSLAIGVIDALIPTGINFQFAYGVVMIITLLMTIPRLALELIRLGQRLIDWFRSKLARF
jgi:hypothetical protein